MAVHVTPGDLHPLRTTNAINKNADDLETAHADIDALEAVTHREVLTANRTYYCDWTDGDDANDGLSAGSGNAFKTLQKAYDTILTLDLNGNTVTVSCADGTYTSGLSITKPWVGGSVTFQGNTTTPDNVLISTSGNCIAASCVLPGTLTFTGFKVTSSAASGVVFSGIGFITLNKVNTGACAAFKISVARAGANLSISGNYTDSGNAQRHFSVTDGGFLQTVSITTTVSGTPAYSVAFALAAQGGRILAFFSPYSGSATGPRRNVTAGGIIQTFGSGDSYFPGSSVGVGTNFATSPYGMYS